MIDIAECGRDRSRRSGSTQPIGDVDESVIRSLTEQRRPGAPDDEEIGAIVVVEIGHDRSRRRPATGKTNRRRDVRETSSIVVQHAEAARTGDEHVERAVPVVVGNRYRATAFGIHRRHRGRTCDGPAGNGCQRWRQAESHIRGRRVHEIRLETCRDDGFRITPLLEIGGRERRAIAAVAERFEPSHRLLCFVGPTGPGQRHGESVGGGDVERLGADGAAKEIDRGVELAPLQVELTEIHLRAEVAGIEVEHPAERLHGVVDAVLGPGDESEHVWRLRRVGSEPGRVSRGSCGAGEVGPVVERNREIDVRDRQRPVRGNRLPEGVHGGVVVVLLEIRDAEVVAAIGGFPRRRRAWRRLTHGHRRHHRQCANDESGGTLTTNARVGHGHHYWRALSRDFSAAGVSKRRSPTTPRPSSTVRSRLTCGVVMVSVRPEGQTTRRLAGGPP